MLHRSLLVVAAACFSSYRLMAFVTAMGSATRCCCSMGCGMGCAGMRCWRVRSLMGCATASRWGMGYDWGGASVGPVVAGAHDRCAARMSMIDRGTMSTGIPSTTPVAEAMATPTVTIAPVGPRAHA
jgi:hypothetical protein